jgi:hypothetical protein
MRGSVWMPDGTCFSSATEAVPKLVFVIAFLAHLINNPSQSSWQSIHLSHSLACVRNFVIICYDYALMQISVAVGGTAGYIRTRSTPSLVAGLVLGASYGYAGMSFESRST